MYSEWQQQAGGSVDLGGPFLAHAALKYLAPAHDGLVVYELVECNGVVGFVKCHIMEPVINAIE
jgi:hypothetical protein